MNKLPASWSLRYSLPLAAREGVTVSTASLNLSEQTRDYLDQKYPSGLFRHQHLAVEKLLAGDNVCIATPTASGKSAVFQTAALEILARDPEARILALYPMKALGCEQEARWVAALKAAGIAGGVGRIDGNVRGAARNLVCSKSRVLIATPDVVHTWLLTRAATKGFEAATRFVRNLRLVVVDEAHTYSGVFGSNSAFAFRRLQHMAGVLGGGLQWVACSATMRDAKGHLERLVGRPFAVIGEEEDSSQRHEVSIDMVAPNDGVDFHSGLAELLGQLRDSGEQFLAFFDSRKASEQMAAILHRDEPGSDTDGFDHLLDRSVLPYRAGYEADHRKVIQDRLTDGSLRGVLSTSTLELGLDLPHLKTVVLVGVPSSGTNLRQRIGRVGRSCPGRVIVVNTGSLGDTLVFEQPSQLLARPLHESTIYLENRRIQYIHAMALARIDGEHDHAALAAKQPSASLLQSVASWPEGFLALCDAEHAGVVPRELQDMRRDAGEQPTLTFMLRDVEPQFDVEQRSGFRRGEKLGTLSHGQVMREAYPGAVYYYTGRPYRVTGVNVRQRKVFVQPCARHTTKPVPVRSQLTPQSQVFGGLRSGQLSAIECELQLWRKVLGFSERAGSKVEQVNYPCESPVRYEQPNFSRALFTTGVCLAHPELDRQGVDPEMISALLLEAFLHFVPIERQDVDVDTDCLRASCAGLEKGRRIVALFDQAAGGLRITERLSDPEVLRSVLEGMVAIIAERTTLAVKNEERPISLATRAALEAMRNDAQQDVFAIEGQCDPLAASERVAVLLPKSLGVVRSRPSEQFEIHKVFNHPTMGVAYRGVFIGSNGERSSAQTVTVDMVEGLAGHVVQGFYDPETDEQVAA
jgi:DEAD/DEAH box helicase domain-containing protein